MKTEELAREVIARLKGEGKTLATAESCTGGLLGKLLTDVPGASSVYKGGVISYVNEVKHRLLGVDQQTLDVCTAVSRETAHEMAKGAREVVRSDVGVSTTGLAGPGRRRHRKTGRAGLCRARHGGLFLLPRAAPRRETGAEIRARRRTRRFPCCWNSCNRICLGAGQVTVRLFCALFGTC